MSVMKPLHQTMILVSVFLTGMAVLIIEILATRVLAPYFGNSIYTFSSVISIILLALSLGYFIGGRLSDRKLSHSLFYKIILFSGLSVIGLHFLTIKFVPTVSYQFNIITGPLFMSLFLFFIPAFILGLLSPYAIRLLQTNQAHDEQGKYIGNVFFWSTLGSITGSLATGFFLIPNFKIDLIIAFLAYGLLLLSAIGLWSISMNYLKWFIVILAFIVIHYIFSVFLIKKPNDVVYYHQGLYENISVIDKNVNDRTMRLLLQDKNPNSGIYLDNASMAFDYTKYYELFKLFTPQTKHFLSIGGGAYSVPKDIIKNYSEISVDTVEIEPALYDIAKDYFLFSESDQHSNHIKDGRRFLYDTKNTYDAIFSDVYRSFAAVPMHFVTQEFFNSVLTRLNINGVFIANVYGSTKNKKLILSLAKTMQSVFPQIYIFATVNPDYTGLQNFIFVGHNNDKRIDLTQANKIQFIHPELKTVSAKEFRIDSEELTSVKMFTDFYAPTEYLATSVIQQYQQILKENGIINL